MHPPQLQSGWGPAHTHGLCSCRSRGSDNRRPALLLLSGPGQPPVGVQDPAVFVKQFPDHVLLNFVQINDFSIIRLLGRHCRFHHHAQHGGPRRGGAALRAVRPNRRFPAPLRDRFQPRGTGVGVEGGRGRRQSRRRHHLPLLRGRLRSPGRPEKGGVNVGSEKRLCDWARTENGGWPTPPPPRSF